MKTKTIKTISSDRVRCPRLASEKKKRPANVCLLPVFLMLLCGLPFAGRAQTPVSGVVAGETWTAANSPYVVVGNILVATLTIQSDVTVEFAGNYVFEVGGVLTAVGTSNSPIVFTCTNAAVGWQGLFFNYSSPGSELGYCVISNSVNRGLRILSSQPVVHDCTIANNSTPSGDGGGVWINGNGITLENCTLMDNTTSAGSGGGLYAAIVQGDLVLHSCTIANNTARYYGGGIWAAMSTNTLVLECCEVRRNTANPNVYQNNCYAGGVGVTGSLRMRNCLVVSNALYAHSIYNGSRHARGGGVYAEGRAEINNCIFRGNYARGVLEAYGPSVAYGTGMMAAGGGPLSLVNCIFSDNTAAGDNGNYGGGLYINTSVSSPVVDNCTFAYNNVEGLYTSASTAAVMNSILFFNASGGTQIAGTTNVTYCDVQGGFPGVGNINFQPIFHSQTNLVIVPGSRCIDAGNPATAYNDACFDGNWYGAAFSLGTTRNDMGVHGGPGACCWTCGSGTVPVIRSQPQSTTACVGGQASFGVGVTGSQPITYQWRFHGTNIAGAPVDIPNATNATFTISSVQATDAGYYSVQVANPLGSVDSDPPVLLTVMPVCVEIDLYAGLNITGGVPGQNYSILSTFDLTPPLTWVTNTTITQSVSGVLWLDTNSPANKPKKFYMVTE